VYANVLTSFREVVRVSKGKELTRKNGREGATIFPATGIAERTLTENSKKNLYQERSGCRTPD